MCSLFALFTRVSTLVKDVPHPQENATMPLTNCLSTLKPVHRNLKPNPFTTYRDPETGVWIVVKSTAGSMS